MNKVFKFAAFFAASIVIFFFVACQKDNIPTEIATEQSKMSEKMIICPDKKIRISQYEAYHVPKEQMIYHIRKFSNAVKKGAINMLPSSMPLEEVVWNLETQLNFRKGHLKCQFRDRRTKEFEQIIVLQQDEKGKLIVNGAEVLKQYLVLYQKIEQLEASIEGDHELYLIDVGVVKNEKNELVLEVRLVFGVNSVDNTKALCSNINNSWFIRTGPNAGSCSPNVSLSAASVAGQSASDILFGYCTPNFLIPSSSLIPHWDVNTHNPIIISNVEYMPVINTFDDYAINDLSSSNPFQRYLLYKYSTDMNTPSTEVCVSTSNIRFYRNGVFTILERFFKTHPLISQFLDGRL